MSLKSLVSWVKDCGIANEIPCSIYIKRLKEAVRIASSLEAENKELRGEIGSPPEGSHPDEASPRDETWHGERLNWIEQVKALESENKELRELLVLAKPYIKSLNLLGDVEMALDPVFKKLVADELKEQ